MKNDFNLVQEIKDGDNTRKEFLLNKLKQGLRNYSIVLEDSTLDELFLQSLDSYVDTSVTPLYFHSFQYIKKKLTQEKVISPSISNDFFTEAEMIILNKFFKKVDNQYLSAEEIAEDLNQPILHITTTIQRFKTQYSTKPKVVQSLFENVDRILEKGNSKNIKEFHKTISLNEKDILLLGQFTGQINDICIDLEDLSTLHQCSIEVITNQLRTIYTYLETKENMDLILKRYPDISKILPIRARILEIDSPLFSPKQKKREGKKKKTSQKSIKSTSSKPRSSDVEFLIGLYQKKEDGTYFSFRELASQAQLQYNSFCNKKNTLLKKFHTDLSFQKEVLKKYPDFIKLKEDYQHSSKVSAGPNSESEQRISDYKFLYLLFQKKEDGTYFSFQKLAEQNQIKYPYFIYKKGLLLKKLEENEAFRKELFDRYPDFEERKQEYENRTKQKKNERKLGKQCLSNIEFVSLLYQKKEDGTYYSNQELASQLQLKYASFLRKKQTLLKRIETEPKFRELLLQMYPNFFEMQQQFLTFWEETKPQPASKTDKKEEKLQTDIDFLYQLYEKVGERKYPSVNQQAEQHDMLVSTFCTKKYRLLRRFREDSFFQQKVLEKYPTFLEEQQQFFDYQETKRLKWNTSGLKKEQKLQSDIEFLHQLYQQDEENGYLCATLQADRQQMQIASFRTKKSKLLKRFRENSFFQQKVLEKYPTFLEEQQQFFDSQKTSCSKKKETSQNNRSDLPSDIEFPYGSYQKDPEKEYLTFNQQIEQYPNILDRIEQLPQEKNSSLSTKEKQIIESLYSDRTKKVVPFQKEAAKLEISPALFSLCHKSGIGKIKNNPKLQQQYPDSIQEHMIREGFKKKNSISVSEEQLETIRQNVRQYDIPNLVTQDRKKNQLLKGIQSFEISCFQDYASLCTMEQKAMLALRLGFFNETIFGTEDVAEIFHTDPTEISLLTKECLKLKRDTKTEKKELKKSNS